MKKTVRSKRAFTLIELLVVVLIIGILAAIAVPQYQKAVEKARAAEAMVILKKIDENASLAWLAKGGDTLGLEFDEVFGDIPSEMPVDEVAGLVTENFYYQFILVVPIAARMQKDSEGNYTPGDYTLVYMSPETSNKIARASNGTTQYPTGYFCRGGFIAGNEDMGITDKGKALCRGLSKKEAVSVAGIFGGGKEDWYPL